LSVWTTGTVERLTKSLRRFSFFAIALDALENFGADHMAVFAASMAYYTLLAVFPLLLLLVAIASPFLNRADVLEMILHYVSQTLPGARDEIEIVLQQVLEHRGPASLVGLITLLWSASGVFDVVQTALNRAWRVPRARAFFQERLFSVLVIVFIGGLFVLGIFLSTITDDVVRTALAWTRESVSWAGRIGSWFATFTAFSVLYKYFPNARVHWRSALLGAGLTAVFWELAKSLYGEYLVQYARLSLVYGSFGAVIGLLLWSYLSSTILLFGAEFSAQLERAASPGPPAQKI
jgi:membrane protein